MKDRVDHFNLDTPPAFDRVALYLLCLARARFAIMEEANMNLVNLDALRHANFEFNLLANFRRGVADIKLATVVMGN